MNNLQKNIIRALFGILILTSITSCDEGGNPNAGGTTTQKFAGEWYIIAHAPDGTEAIGYGLYSTFNAASNDQNFWIDDHDLVIGLKTKVQAISYTDLTFSGKPNEKQIYPNTPDSPHETSVTVSNGKIFPKKATSFGGHVVDSIYFEVEFASEPGAIYKFAGHKRTGFKEDEL